MAHDYRGIDADIVFDIISEELEPLKKALLGMLGHFSFSKMELEKVISSPHFKHIPFASGYFKIES